MHFSCSDKFSPQRSLALDIAVNLNTKNPSGTDNFDCLHSFVVVFCAAYPPSSFVVLFYQKKSFVLL